MTVTDVLIVLLVVLLDSFLALYEMQIVHRILFLQFINAIFLSSSLLLPTMNIKNKSQNPSFDTILFHSGNHVILFRKRSRKLIKIFLCDYLGVTLR